MLLLLLLCRTCAESDDRERNTCDAAAEQMPGCKEKAQCVDKVPKRAARRRTRNGGGDDQQGTSSGVFVCLRANNNMLQLYY